MTKRLMIASLAMAVCAMVTVAASWAGEVSGSIRAVSIESVSSPEMGGAAMDRVSVVVSDGSDAAQDVTLYYPMGRLGSDTALGMEYKSVMRAMMMDSMRPMMMGPHGCAMKAMAAKAKCMGKKPCAKMADGKGDKPCCGKCGGKKVTFTYDDESMVIQKTTFWSKKPCGCAAEAK